jgi:hypothetical protein
LSALLGGRPSSILFDLRFQFITTQFTLNEIKKYLPRLAKKLNISQKELKLLLEELPFLIYPKSFYNSELKKSRRNNR